MMTRKKMTMCALTACLAIAALEGTAAAQAAGRRAVRRESGVTGVELGIDGALEVPRGGTLRWILAAHEVTGLRDLRPATGATVSVTTSLDPRAVAAEATTNAYGRAQIELDVPDDAPASFRAVITLRSADELQRRFELTVRTTEPRSLQLYAARTTVRPGGRLQVFGRFSNLHTGRPLPQETVELLLRDVNNRPLGAPVRVATDRAGLFAHTLRVPAGAVEGVLVQAHVEDDDHPLNAYVGVDIVEPTPVPMYVAVAPESDVVRPGQRISLDVVVRTPNGRPIPRAVVSLDDRREDEAGTRAVTDARGRAQLFWTAPRRAEGIVDTTVFVTAQHEGYGEAQHELPVRVSDVEWAAALAVEGGMLIPSVGGWVWVRATGVDGQPAPAGVPVELSGPRLRGGTLRGTTDESGVARFDVELAPLTGGSTDRCGGDNATAVDVVVGAGAGHATREACLPLDPDASARVRVSPTMAQPGGRVRVDLVRTAVAGRLPVSVVILARRDDRLHALSSRVLPAGEDTLELELPSDVVGEVVVRARPLYGTERHEVRGGSASLWVSPGQAMDVHVDLSASEDQAQLSFVGPADGLRSVYLVALPVDVARALAARLRQASLGPLNDFRQPATAATEALIAAALAAGLTRDVGAPAILRRGDGPISVPAPENPERLGLLRDPWRAQARFVTGRLALIFNAIEDEVSRSVAERIDDVALRDGGAWRFNTEIVEAIADSDNLGSAGVTGMGGEPLTIEALQQYDAAFNYNNVARRITRERLFRLILALRQFVNSSGFDLPWSRLGDPAEWLRTLPGQTVPDGSSLQRQDLVDGWGRPFVLRRAGGGRTRFTLVSPLGGWELVSQGPDGRPGNADDLWDPTARVLPAGSAYAEAVGEEVLLARLRGVEQGRATVDVLRGAGGEYSRSVGSAPSRPEEATEQLAQQLWRQLPSVIVSNSDALALRRPNVPDNGSHGRVLSISPSGGTVALELDEEPRTWGAVAFAWTTDGFPAVGLSTTTAGAPLIVEADLPRRIRQGEPLSIPVHLTNLTRANHQVSATASAEGPVRFQPSPAVTLGAETSGSTLLQMEGTAPGVGRIALVFSDQGGRELRRLSFAVRVDSGAAPIRLRAGAAVTGRRWRTRLDLPNDSTSPTGRVVVLTPSGLSSDPDLADVRRRDPALVAWATALSGHALSDAQRAALDRAQNVNGWVEGAEPALSTACALMPWSALGADDAAAVEALRNASDALPHATVFSDPDGDAAGVRTAAAVLAAIAPGGVPELDDGAGLDPVAQHAAMIRAGLRRTIHTFPEEPALLARAAAALLLADPRDGHGRAMVERAEAHLEEIEGVGLRVARTEGRPDLVDSLTATLALAVALHQLERDDLAERLLRGAFAQENVLTRVGGETTFWYLAAAAYGAMGAGTTERVTVTVGGQDHVVDVSSGRAVVPIERLNAGRATTVAVERIGGPALLVRAEVVMGRRFAERDEGPLALEIQGDVGRGGELSALELSATASRAVGRPVLDIQLPAGVNAEGQLVETLEASSSVLSAEPRAPGFVRVSLAPIAEGATVVLPLPLRWTARGQLRGLGVIAYPESSPQAMTVLQPRVLEVQ